MELLPYLLPLGDSFQVNQLRIESEDHIIAVELEAIASNCPCPSCRLPAERIHSHYQRTVADLPWAELIVRLHLLVRKFFCDNRACPRKIFTERLPSLVAPSARRSLRLIQQQQQMGLALGGNETISKWGKRSRKPSEVMDGERPLALHWRGPPSSSVRTQASLTSA